MEQGINRRQLAIFLGFAFGIAWIFGLIIYLTGGISNSPEIIHGSKITLAIILLTLGYMWAPALANIFTRLVTHQGWTNLLLVPAFKKSWKFWVIAWFSPFVLTILGATVFFLIFPAQFDSKLSTFSQLIQTTSPGIAVNPWLMILGEVIKAILIAPIINSFFTFGEEFGWRGYLLPTLLPLGEMKAYLISGLIWGLWHAPVIAMGHNYGLDYPGAPWLGILVMIWFTTLIGALLGWLSIRSGSVWPAVIGHAAINGISALPLLFILVKPNLLIGPAPMGLIGSAGYLFIFVWILISTRKAPSQNR
jgi:uncharacterized protein